jgi:hypothetical protein
MAEGDAPASAHAAVAASPRSPMPPETPATLKRRQRGLVSRVWKGIFGGREDVEKLLQALSKEEEAVRARLRRRARSSRQSAHNVLALAAALEVIRLVSGTLDYPIVMHNIANVYVQFAVFLFLHDRGWEFFSLRAINPISTVESGIVWTYEPTARCYISQQYLLSQLSIYRHLTSDAMHYVIMSVQLVELVRMTNGIALGSAHECRIGFRALDCVLRWFRVIPFFVTDCCSWICHHDYEVAGHQLADEGSQGAAHVLGSCSSCSHLLDHYKPCENA